MSTRTIWDKIIGEYAEYGFNVKYPDDFILELYFKDKKIASFYRDKITPEVLQEGCKNFIKNLSWGL
jgi:hypothetical protein